MILSLIVQQERSVNWELVFPQLNALLVSTVQPLLSSSTSMLALPVSSQPPGVPMLAVVLTVQEVNTVERALLPTTMQLCVPWKATFVQLADQLVQHVLLANKLLTV